MIELIGWINMIGLAVAIAGIYVVSIRIEKHMRETTQMMIDANAMIVAQLKRLSSASVEAPEPVVGVILDRRCAHRRARGVPTSERAREAEQRKSPGRRREDLALVRSA